ncbi:MAG: type II secretion system protein [Campylobacterales bacterium]
MKYAFTLLELIVGIVVIGIAFLSIPAIMTVMNYSSEATVDNKGYYHGLAQMSVIMSKEWDENNTDDWEDANVVYIIDSDDSGCSDRNGTNPSIAGGLYHEAGRRQCAKDGGKASSSDDLGLDSGESFEKRNFDDIDDFHNENRKVESFSIDVVVSYVDTNDSLSNGNSFKIDPASPAGTTNLKQVTVKVKNDDATGTESTLKYIGANIGYDELLSRDFE